LGRSATNIRAAIMRIFMQNLLTHLLLCSTRIRIKLRYHTRILTSTTKPTMFPMFTISTRITLTTKLPLKKIVA